MRTPFRQKLRAALGLVSLLAFPATFYYLSPVVPVMGSIQGIITGSILVFAGLALSGLVLGRAFCSWLCPAGVLQDMAAKSRTSPFRRRPWNLVKYAVWIPWLGVLVYFFRQAGGVQTLDPWFLTEGGLSTASAQALVVFLIVEGSLWGLAMLFGRRAACHTVCWMAPFMIVGQKLGSLLRLPRLQVAAAPSPCTSCGTCTLRCPMSLPVEEMRKKGRLASTDCIVCGNCVDGCPGKALSLAWRGDKVQARS